MKNLLWPTLSNTVNSYQKKVPRKQEVNPGKSKRTIDDTKAPVDPQIDVEQLNTTFANLGREIASFAGEDQDGYRKVEGEVNYKISINLTSNTMRIYAKDRGEQPILIDADGHIDHASARVDMADVEFFKAIVGAIQVYESKQERQTAQAEY